MKIPSSNVKSSHQNMDVLKRRWNYCALINKPVDNDSCVLALFAESWGFVCSESLNYTWQGKKLFHHPCLLHVISNSDSLKWSGEQECGSVTGYKWVDILKHWLSLFKHEVHLFPVLVRFTWRNVSVVGSSWESYKLTLGSLRNCIRIIKHPELEGSLNPTPDPALDHSKNEWDWRAQLVASSIPCV